MDGTLILKRALTGLLCTTVSRSDYLWQFTFGNRDAALNLECPWRLLAEESIVYGYEDHGQKFGHSEPVDGVKKTETLIANSPVSLVEIQQGSADLSITFENGVRLQAFNGSSGYEGWTCAFESGLTVVAQGGGNLTVWNPNKQV
jgi:Family of unknown function (DUF6188)